MRAELVPDDYDKKPPKVTADGVDSKGKHRKRIKCQEIKYNKFQMYDLKDAAATLANHTSGGGATSPDKSPIHLQESVESDVKEIRRSLRQLLNRIHQKEERAKVNLEWKIVALVLDRVFFLCYLASNIISLATIFPKT
jgi:nicotinic acetylcholine receptor